MTLLKLVGMVTDALFSCLQWLGGASTPKKWIVDLTTLNPIMTAARLGDRVALISLLETGTQPVHLAQCLIKAIEIDHRVAITTLLEIGSGVLYERGLPIKRAIELERVDTLRLLMTHYFGRPGLLQEISRQYRLKSIANDPTYDDESRQIAQSMYDILQTRYHNLITERK